LGLGPSVGDVISGGVLRFFGQLYLALGANPMCHFLAQGFLAIYVIIRVFRAFDWLLAYLEPKLWLKNQKFVKTNTFTNADPGYIIPY